MDNFGGLRKHTASIRVTKRVQVAYSQMDFPQMTVLLSLWPTAGMDRPRYRHVRSDIGIGIAKTSDQLWDAYPRTTTQYLTRHPCQQLQYA